MTTSNTKYHNQLRTFLRILNEYPEDGQLSRFLPVFFRANRQMGSGDRRTASRLLYNYFRLGKASASLSPEERLFIAEFLCNSHSDPFLENFRPDLNSYATLPIEEKIRLLEAGDYDFRLEDVFPFHKHLSSEIEQPEFLRSFFIQPDLFIRIHPGREAFVKSRLRQEAISFTEYTDQTLALPNGTKLDQLFSSGKGGPEGIEVQDLSSQEAGSLFKPNKYEHWWDCCAASGGKSLYLFHQQPDIKLLVSDIRDNILENLDERFRAAGVGKYQKKILDLTKDPQPFLHGYSFDGIILDAPCSGSGTWGRSPELISQFKESRIEVFQRLQRSIAANVIKYLKPGKPLIYITCSVFKEENEDNVDFLVNNYNLQLEEQKTIKGYGRKADTMFAARLCV